MRDLIEMYIKNLKVDNVNDFLLKENICLSKYELDIVYNYVKKDYKILLSGDYEKILLKIKSNLSEDNYNKIYDLFMKYKNKI